MNNTKFENKTFVHVQNWVMLTF